MELKILVHMLLKKYLTLFFCTLQNFVQGQQLYHTCPQWIHLPSFGHELLEARCTLAQCLGEKAAPWHYGRVSSKIKDSGARQTGFNAGSIVRPVTLARLLDISNASASSSIKSG